MEVGSGTNRTETCKVPIRSPSPAYQHPVLFTSHMPFLSRNQQCQSTERGLTTVH